ncbi:MAG: putative metal-dependent hydrolase [Chitinophagaceae bacterium]|nr:putative metal-dependent hydrolase [Chitinophagaceae bacterium]
MPDQEDLQYPIGKADDQPYNSKLPFSEEAKKAHLQNIKDCPAFLENAILNLDEKQLDTSYRPGGWTIKQVVHHVADSHMNAFIRFKLGLTEDNPTIKPYEEAAWAKLSDTANIPINISLTLLHALHIRWYELMKNMSEADWQRTVFHPENKRSMKLWDLLATYSWHGKHHTAHITKLRERMGW